MQGDVRQLEWTGMVVLVRNRRVKIPHRDPWKTKLRVMIEEWQGGGLSRVGKNDGAKVNNVELHTEEEDTRLETEEDRRMQMMSQQSHHQTQSGAYLMESNVEAGYDFHDTVMFVFVFTGTMKNKKVSDMIKLGQRIVQNKCKVLGTWAEETEVIV